MGSGGHALATWIALLLILNIFFLIKYVRSPFQKLLNAIVNPKISASGKTGFKKNLNVKKLRPWDIIIKVCFFDLK
jgi:hypothetical protein